MAPASRKRVERLGGPAAGDARRGLAEAASGAGRGTARPSRGEEEPGKAAGSVGKKLRLAGKRGVNGKRASRDGARRTAVVATATTTATTAEPGAAGAAEAEGAVPSTGPAAGVAASGGRGGGGGDIDSIFELAKRRRSSNGTTASTSGPPPTASEGRESPLGRLGEKAKPSSGKSPTASRRAASKRAHEQGPPSGDGAGTQARALKEEVFNPIIWRRCFGGCVSDFIMHIGGARRRASSDLHCRRYAEGWSAWSASILRQFQIKKLRMILAFEQHCTPGGSSSSLLAGIPYAEVAAIIFRVAIGSPSREALQSVDAERKIPKAVNAPAAPTRASARGGRGVGTPRLCNARDSPKMLYQSAPAYLQDALAGDDLNAKCTHETKHGSPAKPDIEAATATTISSDLARLLVHHGSDASCMPQGRGFVGR
eukprot:SM000023S07556  [mRNA]  locus=s23:157555:160234:+ [translate_table: standard]